MSKSMCLWTRANPCKCTQNTRPVLARYWAIATLRTQIIQVCIYISSVLFLILLLTWLLIHHEIICPSAVSCWEGCSAELVWEEQTHIPCQSMGAVRSWEDMEQIHCMKLFISPYFYYPILVADWWEEADKMNIVKDCGYSYSERHSY